MSLEASRSLLTEVVRGALAGSHPVLPEAASAPPSWTVAAELGWPGVSVAEEAGGSGGSFADLTAIVEAAASVGISLPIPETALSRAALVGADLPWGTDDVASIAAVDDDLVEVDGGGDRATVRGELTGVPWAAVANRLVLVWPRQVAAVALSDDGVTVDGTVNIAGESRARVTFEGAPATLHTAPEGISPDAVRDRLAVLRAAMMVGAATGALRLSKEHVTTREQFGRPLSRFQLVSSSIAQMAGELTLARASLETAVEAHLGDRHVTAHTAAAYLAAARMASIVARASHQVHGAIGVTQEHSLHHYTRRLWSWRDDVGSELSWRRRLGRSAITLGVDGVWAL